MEIKLMYWKYWEQDNIVYSCDKVYINAVFQERFLENINKYLENINRGDIIRYSPCFSEFKYRYMYKIQYMYGSLILGICLNGSHDDRLKGYFVFNPNKCLADSDSKCMEDINFLLDCCHSAEVKRFDVAIDIPIERNRIHLLKDHRQYMLMYKSVLDCTEYLGKRSNVGYVKLYNKMIESELEEPLTRLEITFSEIHKIKYDILPTVYIEGKQENMIDDKLTSTQRVLVQLLRICPTPSYYISQLSYRLKKKIMPYVMGEGKELIIDKTIIYKLCSSLKIFER